jgi:hypothetical protein
MLPVDSETHCGRRLAPGEQIVWEGKPSIGALAIDVFHIRPVISYFVLLSAVGFARALGGHVFFFAALMPLASGAAVAGLLYAAAYGVSRSTGYVITTRRIVLRFGLVLPRALSIPFCQIASMSVSVATDGHGDIALRVRGDNRMPYLKLWPHVRPWHLRTPQPMLRGIAAAGLVASMLSRCLSQAELQRANGESEMPQQSSEDILAA